MTSTNVAYVASGFQDDCIQLLEIFKKKSSIRFEAFCEAWQEMKFSLVFLCRKTYAEILEFCEESLIIAKQFLFSSELLDQVGGLYLLYGVYNKIPVYNVKIRLTLSEWRAFLELYKQIKSEKLYDATYIFTKLVIDDAFHHSLVDKEYGLQKTYKSFQEYSLDNPYSILPSIIDEVENGGLAQMEKLSKIYNNQKIKLLNNESSQTKLQLFDKNFLDDIVNDIEELQDKRQMLKGLRKKSKEINFSIKTEKAKYSDDKIRSKLGHGFDTDSSDDEDINIPIPFVKAGCPDLPNNFDVNEDDDNDDDDDDNDDDDGDDDGDVDRDGDDDNDNDGDEDGGNRGDNSSKIKNINPKLEDSYNLDDM